MLEPKRKKCRGTGKAKNFGCGKEKFKRTLGLCNSCYPKWLLNTSEGKERLKKHTLKVLEPRLKLKKVQS